MRFASLASLITLSLASFFLSPLSASRNSDAVLVPRHESLSFIQSSLSASSPALEDQQRRHDRRQQQQQQLQQQNKHFQLSLPNGATLIDEKEYSMVAARVPRMIALEAGASTPYLVTLRFADVKFVADYTNPKATRSASAPNPAVFTTFGAQGTTTEVPMQSLPYSPFSASPSSSTPFFNISQQGGVDDLASSTDKYNLTVRVAYEARVNARVYQNVQFFNVQVVGNNWFNAVVLSYSAPYTPLPGSSFTLTTSIVVVPLTPLSVASVATSSSSFFITAPACPSGLQSYDTLMNLLEADNSASAFFVNPPPQDLTALIPAQPLQPLTSPNAPAQTVPLATVLAQGQSLNDGGVWSLIFTKACNLEYYSRFNDTVSHLRWSSKTTRSDNATCALGVAYNLTLGIFANNNLIWTLPDSTLPFGGSAIFGLIAGNLIAFQCNTLVWQALPLASFAIQPNPELASFHLGGASSLRLDSVASFFVTAVAVLVMFLRK